MGKLHVIAEPGAHDVTLTRVFDAPRELVFKAYTDPELMQRWLGPRDAKMIVDHLDMRTGGSYRYSFRDAEGNEQAFRGAVHSVDAPTRVIQTFEWEGFPGVSLQTSLFEDEAGRTKVTEHLLFQSTEDREAAGASGMEEGGNEVYERLDELLADLQRQPAG